MDECHPTRDGKGKRKHDLSIFPAIKNIDSYFFLFSVHALQDRIRS